MKRHLQRLAAWARWWIGRDRLSRGYCPACNSSPPDPSCQVCWGSHSYSNARLSDEMRERWARRWDALCGHVR